MLHIPQNFQAAQIVEPITGINKRSAAWLCLLSEELKDFQCSLSPSTLFLALACPFLLDLHLQHILQLLLRLLLCPCRLYS